VGCCFLLGNISLAAEPNGFLKIEGKYVKHLVLNGKSFDEPNEIISLPPGIYRLSEIRLQGDFVSHPYKIASSKINIEENKTTLLKMGAPLNQSVDVLRKGNSLILNYQLQGIGGELYFPEMRDDPPKCTIYAGDKEIANCSFKYG
jgi:hypothetical protein